MKNLRRYVGTSSALIAFEAAGRHLNFSRAAREMNVSQPAISRQIRNLELHIGKPLFARRGNKVRLTQSGKILFEATNSSFNNIITAIERITNETRENTLILRSQPIFLSAFVLPLLVDLQGAFPELFINIQSLENTAEVDKDRMTISILYGEGNWPSMKSELLYNDIYVPVCHPLILKGIENTRFTEIFNHLPLLQMSEFIDPWMNWHKWGAHFEIDTLTSNSPQLFNDYDMLLQACRSGHGVAIGALHLVEKALHEGSLVRITDLAVKSKFGFYFVHHSRLTKKQDFVNILSWLSRRAEETKHRCDALL